MASAGMLHGQVLLRRRGGAGAGRVILAGLAVRSSEAGYERFGAEIRGDGGEKIKSS